MFKLLKNKLNIKIKNYFISYGIKKNRGMTYVELIVVLSIFSIMSAVALFDYGKFEARVDIKNLANDIALQIVGAQKNAMAGKLAIASFFDKPAYGVYFKLVDNKQFISFADIDDSKSYNTGDESFVIDITRNNTIKQITVTDSDCSGEVNDLNIVFKRPDSSALVSTSNFDCSGFSKVDIYIASPDGAYANIYVYPSGRIEIK